MPRKNDMDREKYRTIAPLDGEDAINATEYIKNKTFFANNLLKTLYKKAKLETWDSFDALMNDYYYSLGKVKSWKDFQTNIIHKIVMPLIIKGSTDGIIVEGLENVDLSKPHVFVSNHRDIVLDSAFIVNTILDNKGLPLQATSGANLYLDKEAGLYFGLSGCIKVFRGLSLREEYEASMLLSSYIWDSISENYSSIWIAGQAGRSKDGIDRVLPAIVKMLILKERRNASLSDLVNKLSIVPVSISYEQDPNDVDKAREMLSTMLQGGEYKKRPLEDLLSLTRGVRNYKRRVALSFSKPLSGEFESVEDVASEIEKSIRLSYKLFPISYYAYDKVHKSDTYKNMYDKELLEEGELKRFKALKKTLRTKVLEAYAAPLESKLAYEENK